MLNDVVLVSESLEELKTIIEELKGFLAAIGLDMNTDKAKIIIQENWNLIYHKTQLGEHNQSGEISRRIGLIWVALRKLRFILTNKDISVITWGLETMSEI